ncbi:MAG: 5-oxoprolinase subunit PxpA [Pseudoxanthomonas sp.]
MIRTLDFNCDLGEGYDDAAVMPFISSASIACGFHAGDPALMRQTVAWCLQHGVAIGAHPSHDDRAHFGRRALTITPADAYALVQVQIAALQTIARDTGATLQHVKPHGALYNQAAREPQLADAIARAVRDSDPQLLLFGLSGSALTDAGHRVGLRVVHEVFAERAYEADATLTPRGTEGATLPSTQAANAQVLQMLQTGSVTARTGQRVPLIADSLCLHGDRPDAASFAQALRDTLDAAGCCIARPFSTQDLPA